MMNVTPMMTGIICSSRRMMYLPTPTPSRQRFGKAPWRNIALARRNCSGGPTPLSDISLTCRSLHLYLREVEDAERVDLHVGDPVRPHRGGLVVPQRGGREVLGEQCLGLLVQAVGLVKARRRCGLGQELLELRVVIPAPVGP